MRSSFVENVIPQSLSLTFSDFGEFDMSVKKKKKKKTTILDEEGEDSVDNSSDSWGNSERDYSYEEVSSRCLT